MTLEQFHSLTDDEISILWFIVNKVSPPVVTGVDLEPNLFVSIKHQRLVDRVNQCGGYIKDEHKVTFNSMRSKIGIEVPAEPSESIPQTIPELITEMMEEVSDKPSEVSETKT